jgi:hypothetical protein
MPGDALRAWASVAETEIPEHEEQSGVEWNAEDDDELDKLMKQIKLLDSLDDDDDDY